MDLLNIDIDEYIPDIINAYTKVFGAEYKDIIEKRINSVVYITYNDPNDIANYVSFLKACKMKELAVKFLRKIGIDTSKDTGNYAEKLDESLEDLIYEYMGNHMAIEPDFKDRFGIKSWLPVDENTDIEEITKEKISFINFIRGKDINLVTKDNFEEFCKTDEYNKIYDKIQSYLQILEELSSEYKDYLKSISHYQEYIDNEQKRKKDIEAIHKKALYERAEEYLTEDLKKLLDEKYSSIDEKSRALFGSNIGTISFFEYFSKEDEKILEDSSISENDKMLIYFYRTIYFESIGLVIDDEEKFKTAKDKYDYIIKQHGVEKLVLPEENIEKIVELKEQEFKEFQKDFVLSSEDGEEIENEEVKEWMLKRIINKSICVTAMSLNGEYMPALFFTVLSNAGGTLDYSLLHELCHVCKSEGKGAKTIRCGFDLSESDTQKNPYDDQKRKYEVLNENITDIFALEARQILQEEGIYILEPKECTLKNLNDKNLGSIGKDLIKPFIQRYRKQIIRAGVLGDMEALYEVIGQENFEELNDIVNKVASLSRLEIKLKMDKKEDPSVIEYYKQLERLNVVYKNMEKYQERGRTDDLIKSAIDATKITTRKGQIDDAMIGLVNYCEPEKENIDRD